MRTCGSAAAEQGTASAGDDAIAPSRHRRVMGPAGIALLDGVKWSYDLPGLYGRIEAAMAFGAQHARKCRTNSASPPTPRQHERCSLISDKSWLLKTPSRRARGNFHWQPMRARSSVGQCGPMMASTVADDVSTTRAPLSANPSGKRRCLRARAPMIASAYTYQIASPVQARTARPALAQSLSRMPNTSVAGTGRPNR